MTIETLEDWNLVNCCCGMPVCPVPVVVAESVYGEMADRGFVDPADPPGVWNRHLKHMQTLSETVHTGYTDPETGEGYTDNIDWVGTTGEEYDSYYFGGIAGVGCQTWTPISTTICTNGGARTWSNFGRPGGEPDTAGGITVADVSGLPTRSNPSINHPPCTFELTETSQTTSYDSETSTWSVHTATSYSVTTSIPPSGYNNTPVTAYSLSITWADWKAGARALLDPEMVFSDDACVTSDAPAISIYEADEPVDNGSAGLTLTKARYRWQIPATHLGSYFKITWQILTTPTDCEPTLGDDITQVWTGPGDPESPDGDSWLTEWNDLDPPSVPGSTKIVNIRFECYTSAKFGHRPQVTGEAFPPPDV